MSLEAVRILTTVSGYSKEQLESIAAEFGGNWPIQCSIPVDVLVRACKEYEYQENDNL